MCMRTHAVMGRLAATAAAAVLAFPFFAFFASAFVLIAVVVGCLLG